MWKVVSQEQVGHLSRENSIITILVARSMNAEFLRWLYSSWQEIHEIAGAHWHIVIPSNSGKWVWTGEGPSVNDFNTKLSLEIANSYGILLNELPCLIMEDFCEDATPIRVSIPDNERERTCFVDEFAQLVRLLDKVDFAQRDWMSRRSINSEIANALKRKRFTAIGARVLPKAAGVLARIGLAGH